MPLKVVVVVVVIPASLPRRGKMTVSLWKTKTKIVLREKTAYVNNKGLLKVKKGTLRERNLCELK